MTTRIKDWGARPATTKTVVLIFTLTALITAGVVSWWTGGQLETERQGRGALREENRKRDDRLSQRLVRIERGDAALCARSSACREALRRQRQAPAPRREKREARKPEQVADRPPRQPSQPPTVRKPNTGGGGDDPPRPPTTSTPSTPPSSPAAPVVEVDVPPIDIDGDKGLLPQLLPDVNLPPVDVPPITVP